MIDLISFYRLDFSERVSISDNITFAVDGSNGFHRLELARTLIRFAEFDFTYFWEQCIETGRNARKTGRISKGLVNLAMNAFVKCHPYAEACAVTEFSSVVIDCIIAYICHSEGIGLEELWARCISPKSLYEKTIFNRVSEYKTARGINQWINVVRMQEYVRSKLAFIYDNEGNVMARPADYRARKEYFDLAFSVAANETGCPMRDMPSVKVYSPSRLPEAAFMMGRVSKNIYRRLSDVLNDAEMCDKKRLCDKNRDQTALDAFSYVKDMPRPEENDMSFALEAVSALPAEVYVPDSFKALIDLEFDCMAREGIYLSKCPRCGRYFVRELGDKSPYCSRVNSTGKTCSQLISEELGTAAAKYTAERRTDIENNEEASVSELDENISQTVSEEIAETLDELAADVMTEKDAAGNAPENVPAEETAAIEAIEEKTEENENTENNDENRYTEIPYELEKRCQRLYNLLYKRIGRLISETEFREWAKYLSDTKNDLRKGNADFQQLEEFLEYWENAVHKSSKGKKHRHAAFDNYGEQMTFDIAYETNSELVPAEPVSAETDVNEAETKENLSSIFDEAVKEAEEKDSSGISPAGTEASPEERAFKPFTPPRYNTVLEAMLDGKYKSDELIEESGSEDLADIKVNGRKVRLPDWERITRD